MKEVGEREATFHPRSPTHGEEQGSQDDHEAIVMLERAFKLNTIRCIVISSILLILVIIGLALGGAALGNTKDITKELKLKVDQKDREIGDLKAELEDERAKRKSELQKLDKEFKKAINDLKVELRNTYALKSHTHSNTGG